MYLLFLCIKVDGAERKNEHDNCQEHAGLTHAYQARDGKIRRTAGIL